MGQGLKAKALKRIRRGKDADSLVEGYTIEEVATGKHFDVSDENIKKFMLSGQIDVVNLIIKDDGKLAFKEESHLEEIAEMKELVEKLNYATFVYEQGKDEVMSNHEWDAMYDRLVKLENTTGVKVPNTPTDKVGYEVVSELKKERHESRMLSLGKTKSIEDLIEFLGDKEGVLSYKLDGLTVVLTYDNGELQKAITRGNGDIGEVVTNNAKQFKNIPIRIPFKGKLVLRGEAVMSYKTFESVNSMYNGEYKNPRNLCSGSVRQLNSKITADRCIQWYCFEIVSAEGMDTGCVIKNFEFVTKLGFDVVLHYLVNRYSIRKQMAESGEAVEKRLLDIPSDGMVLTYNDREYGLSLGQTAKTPKHSIAFKWEDEEYTTKISGIEWSPSRTGLINPIACFEPVDIDGTTVSRASIHNVSIMEELMLGYGDRVKVYKANMIIPQISENLDRTATIEVPSRCPCCGASTEIMVEPASYVKTLWCTNNNCPAKIINSFKHFVSRDAMNINGVSIATIERLIDAGIVSDFASLYELDAYLHEIASLEGFGMTSANNILLAIEESRKVRLPNLIYALGISNVGLSTAKLICKNFNNNISDIINASYYDLCSIDGVGDVIARSVAEYFNDDEKLQSFIDLYNKLEIVNNGPVKEQSMRGITICVTGSVSVFKNRNQIKDIVEMLGGKLSGSVSKATSYLVTNDKSSGSSKNRAASQYGTEILSEQEFIDKFNLSDYI